ncbi:hypothetical protein V8E54_013480 [Elaphomyces granulatus]
MKSAHDLEMAYLFGDEGHLEYIFADMKVDFLDRCFAHFLILDTTTTAAFVFAALCLASIVVGNLWIIFRCVRSVLGLLTGFVYYQLGRRAATLRIISTLLVFTAAYAVFLKPATLYLYGFIGGWTVEHGELTVSCVNAIYQFINAGITDLTEWHQISKCFGEYDAISWNIWLQDRYASPIDDDDDINHLPGIICALASLVLSTCLSAGYFVAVWITQSPSEPEDTLTVLREEGENYKSLLGQYSGLVDQCVPIIRELVDALGHGKEELARRSDALRIMQETLQASWEANQRLSEVHIVQEEFRRQTDPTNTELRLEVVELTRKLELAQRDLTQVERAGADTSRALTEKVAMLQRELADQDDAAIASRTEIALLRAQVSTRAHQLTTRESSLADTKAALETAVGKCRHGGIKYDSLKASYDSLKESHDNLKASHANLKVSHDSIMTGYQIMRMASQERDQAVAHVATLQAELTATKTEANDVFARLQRDLTLARQAVAQSQLYEASRREEQSALEAKCRAIELDSGTDAESQAKAFARERADLQGQLEKADRELRESQKEVNSLSIDLSFTKDRLDVFEEEKRNASQEIPVRKLVDVSALQRGLTKSELTVATQLSEIADLKEQLQKLGNGVREPTDAALQAQVEGMRTQLAAEKSAHTNDQLRLNKQVQDLEARNQKLQISMSNAEVGRNRCMRNSPPRRPLSA